MGTLTLVTMTSVAMSDEYQEKTFKGFFLLKYYKNLQGNNLQLLALGIHDPT